MDLAIGLFLIGVLSGSLIVLRDWIEAVCPRYTFAATAATASLGIFPASLPRSIGWLAHTSLLSTAAFLAMLALLCSLGARRLSDSTLLSPDGSSAEGVWMPQAFQPRTLGTTFTVLCYAASCQFQLLAVYADLRERRGRLQGAACRTEWVGEVPPTPPTKEAIDKEGGATGSQNRAHIGPAVVVAAAAMLALSVLTGVFGVLAFAPVAIPGNVLRVLSGTPLGGLTHALCAVGVALSSPLMVHPARDCLLGAWRQAAEQGDTQLHWPRPPPAAHAALTAGIVASSLSVALLFDQVMVLISALGSYVLCPLGIGFPGVALLYMDHLKLPSARGCMHEAASPPVSRANRAACIFLVAVAGVTVLTSACNSALAAREGA